MKFERGRQAVFTQQEVTEMQKGFLETLKRITDMTKEIRIRYVNNVDVKNLLKTLVEIECEEIEILEKDIKIEASTLDGTASNDED